MPTSGQSLQHLILPTTQSTAPIQACIVWLHGFGDDQPENWAAEFRTIRSKLPHVRWIHLRGAKLPQPCYQGLVMPAWGKFLEDRCVHVGSRDYENEGIAANATRVDLQALLEAQLAAVPRVIIGGFSMGAAVAAEAALQYLSRSPSSTSKRRLHLIMLNGWLMPGARRNVADGAAAASGLRALISHGKHDEQVGYDCGVEASQRLREGGAEVSFRTDDTSGHAQSGFGPGKDAAIEFIAALVGPRNNASVVASSAAGSGGSSKSASRSKRRRGD